jgi:hypothetical protein
MRGGRRQGGGARDTVGKEGNVQEKSMGSLERKMCMELDFSFLDASG